MPKNTHDVIYMTNALPFIRAMRRQNNMKLIAKRTGTKSQSTMQMILKYSCGLNGIITTIIICTYSVRNCPVL